jgi:hypothetical protein
MSGDGGVSLRLPRPDIIGVGELGVSPSFKKAPQDWGIRGGSDYFNLYLYETAEKEVQDTSCRESGGVPQI